jgi:hypothetical protein
LQRTVLPQVRGDINQLRGSSVVLVFDVRNPRQCFKSYLVPRTVFRETIIVTKQATDNAIVLKYLYRNKFGASIESIIDISGDFQELPAHQLSVKMIVTNFHDFYVGDLQFLANLLGMTNSERYHCLMCEMTADKFNLPNNNTVIDKKRTIYSLQHCLRQFELSLANATNRKTKPANYKGVNQHPLLDVDPQRLVVPILHCPMGLVDKVLESFKGWINMHVELLNNSDEPI